MDGPWKQFYLNGKLAFEGDYFEGQENGIHKYYYDNGKVKEERNYRLGLKDGVWKSFDVDGILMLSSTYQNGDLKKLDGVKVEGK